MIGGFKPWLVLAMLKNITSYGGRYRFKAKAS
jgi:hypothetical protein